MNLVFALAVKEIVNLDEKEFALRGVLTSFACTSFPCKVDFMFAAMIEHDPVNAEREYETTVQLISPDGHVVEKAGYLGQASRPRHEKLRPVGTMGLTFTGVLLDSPGDYELQLIVGGSLMKTLRLSAHLVD